VDLARYTSLFLSDSRDHLQRSNELLLEWERDPGSSTPLAELFRVFHSIKGSASALGLAAIAELAHAAEQILAALRAGTLLASSEILDALLRTVDGLSDGVEAVARQEPPLPDHALLATLHELAPPELEHTGELPSGERRQQERPRVAGVPGRTVGRQVRVELQRLDFLLNDVGELVVARNRLASIADREIGSELERVSGRIGALVSRLQTGVLRARMAPMGEVSDRFPRLVRDLARGLGKEIRLELQGSAIELDRSVLDGLGDPLTHLIRNAADHGIETPAERVAAGKSREGLIRLRVERARDGVIVTLADDGRGIDRAGVRRQAMERGLLDAEAPMPDAAGLLRLLAHPGFTTRSEVTEVSGRGVGIDAVLARVRTLGGRLELKTVPGRGTTFLLHLPVTRAIVRALLVGVGAERYAIPFALLAEAAVHAVAEGEVSLRGESLITADLRSLVGLGNGTHPRRPAVVLEIGGRRTALVVDALLGQHDVVVEQFAAPAGLPPWVGGMTILPDGAPALLLDPAGFW
jgi:two-component system chemotaxis sensor kinase CheA